MRKRLINGQYIKISGMLLLCCMLVVCRKDQPLTGGPAVSSRRTVLVYLGTDNNFSGEAAQKIRQLKNNWNKNIDGNLLVYADAGKKPVLVHIYYSHQRGNVADTIAVYAAENSANPATLTRVMKTVRTYRPAASYGLVVLSHATGWLPADMSYPAPRLNAVIIDRGTDEPGNYMELSGFAEAIPYQLDFIIFDACFMGAVEVAYELKDKARYIVASPAEVLVPGFVYATMMPHLFRRRPDLTAVAREFYDYYNDDRQSGLLRSATVSVVKTSGLEELAQLFKEITATAPFAPENIALLQTFGYGEQSIYFDAGDYLQHLSPERSHDIQTALDRCVIYKASTPSYYSAGTGTLQPVRAFSGLSAYIPQTAYPEANEAYSRLKWADAIYSNEKDLR